MKVKGIKLKKGSTSLPVLDCAVEDGYWKVAHGSLPDIDIDFDNEKRPDVKAYLERRYNNDGMQRVFSVGTFAQEKIRSAIKDVCRVHRVSPATANYITAIIDDGADWGELMRIASSEKKVYDFIQKHPEVFEELMPLMMQPRTAGIHASALVITPEIIKGDKVNCYDILPIKKMNDMLVSEISGTDVDSVGLLKNDVLGIAELSRMSDMMSICNREYNTHLSIEGILNEDLNDPMVYSAMRKGLTQGVFQLSSDGITRFVKSMRPDNINDLIASVALFRPGPLESGSAQGYVDCKTGMAEPQYLWGTYEILKDTYGYCIYQEQISKVAQKIGGLTLGDGVNLVKALSKKKIEKVRKFQAKFFEGAQKNGCPKDVADKIWEVVEAGASYAFNKCIDGDEIIMRHSNTGSITISDMYNVMHSSQWASEHGKFPLRSKYQREGYGVSWSLGDDEKLYINRIKDIRYAGVRSVYRITLENGATIRVTANHKHPTPNGYKRTDELKVGVDYMYCYLGHKKEDTCYRFTDKGKLNNERYHSNKNVEHYTLNSVKGHEGFVSRSTNFTQLKYYIKNLKKDYCEACGKRGARLEVHHINGDHSDSGVNYGNLQTLCASCHKKAHYKMGRVVMGRKGIETTLSKVVSIEYIGKKDVYDVEMCDPMHTFVNSKGIVTCNSHATAYGLTAFIGAWIKVHYPIAFFTVSLKWVDKEKLPTIMNEMREIGNVSLVQPDINISGMNFETDYNTNTIYWSLIRIHQLGAKAVQYILRDRNTFGEYTSLENFIHRIFKYKLKQYKYFNDPDNYEENEKCPVNARHIKNLVYAGAFDKLENVQSPTERFGVMKSAAKLLGFEVSEKDLPLDMVDKHWWWSQMQIDISGIGSIDYKSIFYSSPHPKDSKYGYRDFRDIIAMPPSSPTNALVCATIAEVSEKTYVDKRQGGKKRFGKVVLRQNTDIMQLIMWSDSWEDHKEVFWQQSGRIVSLYVQVKYSDYDEKNVLQLNKGAFATLI